MLAAVTPAGEDGEATLRALFGVKSFARTAGIDQQKLEEEEPRVAEMLMLSSLASLLDNPTLREALGDLERPSNLDDVRAVAVSLYMKSQSRKRTTPSVESTRGRAGALAVAGHPSRSTGRSTSAPGRTSSTGKGGGKTDSKPKGRASQSSGRQQAAHPAILRTSGDQAQMDAFFSLLRSKYGGFCHQQIFRGCDKADCSREHITRGSEEAKEIIAAVSAVCPATALLRKRAGQTGVPTCHHCAAGYCRQGGQCRFAH